MLTKFWKTCRSMAERALARVCDFTRPRRLGGAAIDLIRTRRELIAENTLLRHQLIVLERGAKRPRLSSFSALEEVLTYHGYQRTLYCFNSR